MHVWAADSRTAFCSCCLCSAGVYWSGCESSVLGIIVFQSPPSVHVQSFIVNMALLLGDTAPFISCLSSSSSSIFFFFFRAVHVCVHVWVDGWEWWVRETARCVLSSQRNAINEYFKGRRFDEEYQCCEGRFCISTILPHMNHIFFSSHKSTQWSFLIYWRQPESDLLSQMCLYSHPDSSLPRVL